MRVDSLGISEIDKTFFKSTFNHLIKPRLFCKRLNKHVIGHMMTEGKTSARSNESHVIEVLAMKLCSSIDFFRGRVMCIPPRCYEALEKGVEQRVLFMWAIKSLWPIKGQADTTTKLGAFLAEFFSERQIWRRSPDLVKPCMSQ